MVIDEHELTEVNKTLASIMKMNEVFTGDLMVYYAITEQTKALHRIANVLEEIEMDIRTPDGWTGP